MSSDINNSSKFNWHRKGCLPLMKKEICLESAVLHQHQQRQEYYTYQSSSRPSVRSNWAQTLRQREETKYLCIYHDSVSTAVPLCISRRCLFNKITEKSSSQVKLDDITYDKEGLHYRGKIMGISADSVIHYIKITFSVISIIVIVYIFLRGYVLLSHFSIETVARLGFTAGFVSCLICYTTLLTVVRRYQINANAVYNQAIAIAMRNDKVQRLLSPHPRTGEFKTYSYSGGFRLPLLRRIRSGTYEIADLFALRQRRLKMLFTLKNTINGYEGLVACDVRRETTGLLTSTNVYRSLSVTVFDTKSNKKLETIILIGRPEDVIHPTLIH